MRQSLGLTLSALGCLAAISVGVSMLLEPGMGFAALLAHHAKLGWPLGARTLLFVGAMLALVAGILRGGREGWRAGLFGAVAWGALGLMVGLWAARMPAAPPPPSWSSIGLAVGATVGAVSQLLLGWRGGPQAVRDALLGGVAGATTAWTVAALA